MYFCGIVKEFHKDFVCRFDMGAKSLEVKAALNSVDETINCGKVNLSYGDNLSDFTANLNVFWTGSDNHWKPIDNPLNIRGKVIMEKR